MIICADDFGLSKLTNDGIIELIEKKRITAVTCMVTGGSATDDLSKLKKYIGRLDIGLHLVLTNGRAISGAEKGLLLTDAKGFFYPLRRLLKCIFLKKVSKNYISEEFSAQVNRFEELLGQLPDFVDGHEHIHHLPVVRDVFLSLMTNLKQKKCVYARNSAMNLKTIFFQEGLNLKFILNAFLISYFGARLKKRLKLSGIPSNENLFGYHTYEQNIRLEKAFSFSLDLKLHKNDIFFTHPGKFDLELVKDDKLANFRQKNYDFLLSHALIEGLTKKNISLNTFEF